MLLLLVLVSLLAPLCGDCSVVLAAVVVHLVVGCSFVDADW